VLLCAAQQVNGDKGITLTVGVGLLEESETPEAAVRQAWSMVATQSMNRGESLALLLSRGDSAITVVLTPEAKQAGRR